MNACASVVLVNGLWLPGAAMTVLAGRLRRDGFRVSIFSYPSVRHDLRGNAERLHAFLATVPGDTVHLVGYSLGGLVIRALFHYFPQTRPGRIVLVASPQQGCHAAAKVGRSRAVRPLIGRSVGDLIAGLPQAWPWPAREIGVVAGTRSLGLGRIFSRLSGPNDGTVLVEETAVPGAHDQTAIAVAHSAMLFSPSVARRVAAFLRNGRFAG
jgi:pimeloyl-ACP methyl ester carboxylesterase